MINIDIHADDYALTVNTSKDMLECMSNGLLDSISILCNMDCFEECMQMFYDMIPSMPFLPLISVHIDLIEGKNISQEVPLLSKEGKMSLSWKDVYFMSFSGKRNELKKELKKEIKAQIDKVNTVLNRCIAIAEENNVPHQQKGIRIDSHQHIHSIPLVFDALAETIEENNYPIEYIRNPKEPLLPFLTQFSLWKTYRPVNFIKNRLLMFYSGKNDRYCDDHHMEKMLMWGLMMSGKMDAERIKKIIPEMKRTAEKENRRLELLFHPGLAFESERNKLIPEESMNDFYLNKNRHVEKNAVMQIKEIIEERP